jgi:GrpB-like predicted nucleotidyltransferase (UPF0157 family)
VTELDPLLAERLRTVGLDPAAFGEPWDAWRRLRERFGPRATLIDRYALEAAQRGLRPEQLTAELRARLAAEVLRIQFPALEFAPGSARSVRDAIEVVAHDERWPPRFEQWRRQLADALGHAALRIEHVGSTAVPGLAAKPIVDIQISVRDVEREAAYVPAIERAGVSLRVREPGHRYFRPAGDRPRDVQIHVCDAGSAWERDHLLFRDYLRVTPAARHAYGRLKLELADRYADDRLAYTDAKSAFILDTLDAANSWAARIGWTVLAQRAHGGDAP